MNNQHTALALIMVGAVACIFAGALNLGVLTVPAELASQTALVFQLDWLQGLIEQIDQFLEAVVDLLRTVRRLFGGEGG